MRVTVIVNIPSVSVWPAIMYCASRRGEQVLVRSDEVAPSLLKKVTDYTDSKNV